MEVRDCRDLLDGDSNVQHVRKNGRPDSAFPGAVLGVVSALPLKRPHAKMPLFESVHSRRGARVDESTCLESMRLGNGTVGSNPTLSAKSRKRVE